MLREDTAREQGASLPSGIVTENDVVVDEYCRNRPTLVLVGSISTATTLQYAGHVDRWDELVVRRSVEERDAVAFYLRDGVLAAAFGVNRGRDVRIAKRSSPAAPPPPPPPCATPTPTYGPY